MDEHLHDSDSSNVPYQSKLKGRARRWLKLSLAGFAIGCTLGSIINFIPCIWAWNTDITSVVMSAFLGIVFAIVFGAIGFVIDKTAA